MDDPKKIMEHLLDLYYELEQEVSFLEVAGYVIAFGIIALFVWLCVLERQYAQVEERVKKLEERMPALREEWEAHRARQEEEFNNLPFEED